MTTEQAIVAGLVDRLATLEQMLATLMQQQTTPPPKPAKVAKAKAKPVNGADLAQKDAAIVAGFKRMGITDVILLDRDHPEKPFNVKSYNAWLAEGRQVDKGQHGIRGLFHISQTKPITKGKSKAKR
jgi:hypothetical protein